MAKDVLSKYKFKPGHVAYIDISERSDMGSLQDYFLELTGARTVNSAFFFLIVLRHPTRSSRTETLHTAV